MAQSINLPTNSILQHMGLWCVISSILLTYMYLFAQQTVILHGISTSPIFLETISPRYLIWPFPLPNMFPADISTIPNHPRQIFHRTGTLHPGQLIHHVYSTSCQHPKYRLPLLAVSKCKPKSKPNANCDPVPNPNTDAHPNSKKT